MYATRQRLMMALFQLGLLLWAGGAWASDAAARISERGELAVCVWPDYMSISFRNPRSGELEGIDIDMAKALAEELNVKLRFIETNFAQFMDRLQVEECDIAMFAVGVTAARAGRVAFSQPYLRSGILAVARNNDPRIRRWEDIDQPGNVVAVAAGTFMEPVMRQSLRHAELLSVKAPNTREEELESGRADVFMSDYPYTRRVAALNPWASIISPPQPFSPTDYAYAVRKGDEAWLTRVNEFIARVKRNGRLRAAAKKHGLEPIVVDQP